MGYFLTLSIGYYMNFKSLIHDDLKHHPLVKKFIDDV